MPGRRDNESDFVQHLKNVPIFAGSSDKELREVAKIARETDFAEGTEICRQGQRGLGLHVILEGEVDVRVGDESRPALGPGAYFGEIALIDDGPRSATVTAKTAVKSLSIVAWDFKGLLDRQPDLVRRLLDQMCARLRSAEASTNA